ncbi:hypothetical protein [Streptomyces sp. NPDC096339]|uniref:hypothetical protein n=1 Tax=Streptomyces sp. NPDC096339 TaxID=3366086 RepID=UPI003814FD18
MRKYATALFIAAPLALTDCSGDGEPKAGDSPPPTEEDIAYKVYRPAGEAVLGG